MPRATKAAPAVPEPPEAAPAENPIAAALADYEPPGTDLVIQDPFDSGQVAIVLDRHDEQLILQELQRRVIKVMLYRFPGTDGKEVVDLSYSGVNECIRVMNATGKVKIHIDPQRLDIESIVEDVGSGPEPCWVATVYAVEDHTGYGQFGTFIQPKRTKLKAATITRKKQKGEADGIDDRGTIASPFSRQIALNKAQRNALRVMVPEGIRQTLIAQYIGDTERIRTIEVGAGARTLADLPPALADERSEAQRAEIKRLYDLLHAKRPTAILPAALYAYQVRSDHSHDELDKLIGYVRNKCVEAGVEVPDAG